MATHRSARTVKWSLPVGRVLGVGVRLHVSFLLLLALLTSAGLLAWLVLVFSCVLIHELAHCVEARRRGAEVDEIVLMPIGGVSHIRGLGDDPRVEAWVAVVGPLTSLGLAAAFALIAFAAGYPLLPPDLSGGPVLARLAWLNLLLGSFNLVPAFPMDGGRLMRSLLALRQDPERATHIAAAVGRAFAAVFFVAGLYLNVWLLVIAIFVYSAATSEEISAMLHTRARGLLVGDVMLLDPLSVDVHTPAADIRLLTRRTGQPAFPVLDDGHYSGLLDAAAAWGCGPGVAAADLADGDAETLDVTDPLDPTAFDALEASEHGVVAVVHAGSVVGLLQGADLVERLRREG